MPPRRPPRPSPGAPPDARDGLTRLERIVLLELRRAQAERGGEGVPTAMLYGRVLERIDVARAAFEAALARLGVRRR